MIMWRSWLRSGVFQGAIVLAGEITKVIILSLLHTRLAWLSDE